MLAMQSVQTTGDSPKLVRPVETASRLLGPVHGYLDHTIPLTVGQHQELQIEQETFFALQAAQPLSGFTPKHLETALGITHRQLQQGVRHPGKDITEQTARPTAILTHIAAGE